MSMLYKYSAILDINPMVDKYDDGKRNYEIIMSLNNINNNNIMNDLENINQTNNINCKVEKILDKYQQMNCHSPNTIPCSIFYSSLNFNKLNYIKSEF